jgi:Trypsin-like peptidase domain
MLEENDMLPDRVWRQKLSALGCTYSVIEDRCVLRINEAFLDCVIYLYYSKSDAENASIHNSGGSGFLVGVPSLLYPKEHYVYAVSNRHVIENSKAIRLNTKQGRTDILEVEPSSWFFTQDQDIAVFPIRLSSIHSFRYVQTPAFLTKETLKSEKLGPGDEVFMVGRFVNHEGKQRNTPSVRFGNIAMMPDEPVRHKLNTPKEQVSFLADIRTVGGYSGSPVFVLKPLITCDEAGVFCLTAPHPPNPLLLGVEWGHLLDHENINTGMSGVVPAWYLNDLLNIPELVAIRQQDDARLAQQLAGGGTQLT